MKLDHEQQPPCPSPLPNLHFSSSSSFLRDISNFKTPKRPSQNPNFHSPHPPFFTASKQTPSTSSAFHHSSSVRRPRRPSIAPSTVRSKAARRLKAFELEQSQSSRKAQIQKDKSLKSLSKSLTVWLNFLFENPKLCGCDPSKLIGEDHVRDPGKAASANGKRDSWPGGGVGVDRAWRSPKRQRDTLWGVANVDESAFQNSKMFSALQDSLHEVCSFDDLKQRMRVYLSLGSCKEIFNVMNQVAKNIDEGRIKMKAHCPIVTDVGMKAKATKILMCYCPVWLRIGLYIIFGGESLLPNGDVNSDQETRFLKMIIEKQFFSHPGLAKAYAYNKKVEGLYRPGYFEALGNVILKRFLLLALILDRAKSQSTLPLKHGIDGVDGGSPLLFTYQSNIKSSRQVITDFLSSEVMHGEGNLLAHLVILRYKVPYHQNPLIEYDFRVINLFEDLQDGVRLCRAIQLLRHDSSILTKLVVPSDTHKKNLVNCGIGLQYLKEAGVPMYDEDSMMFDGEDVARGDKELVLSLLWNMFVHLQLPLLINKPFLLAEVSRICGIDEDFLNCDDCSALEMLLKWIQAICEKYDFKVDSFASLVDGKAMWCLLDYYFRKELHCSCSYKDLNATSSNESVVSSTHYADAVHNFILSQKLTTLLGNFPEVLQISDILEHNGPCNERSVVILLVFLSSELIVKKNMDQLNFHKFLGCTCQSPDRKRLTTGWLLSSKAAIHQEEADGHSEEPSSSIVSHDTDALRKFKAIQGWWRDMAERNYKHDIKAASSTLQCSLTSKHTTQRENAAIVIQSYFRQSIECHKYRKIKNAVSLLQTFIRACLTLRWKLAANIFNPIRVQEIPHERMEQSELFRRYALSMVDRHGFAKLKKSVLLIQQAARAWINRRHRAGDLSSQDITSPNIVNNAQSENDSFISKENEMICFQIKAAEKIQLAWKRYTVWKFFCNQDFAATKIQSHFRGWLSRRSFRNKKRAIILIQRRYQKLKNERALQFKVVTRSAIIIQSHVRRWFSQKETCRQKCLIIVIQRYCRAWLTRRHFLVQKEAAIKIQSSQRCKQCWKEFHSYRHAAIQVQRFLRGQIVRRRLLGASRCHAATINHGIFQASTGSFMSFELKIIDWSVLKLQRWWKGILLLKSKTKSAIIIQAHIRGFIARRETIRKRHRIVVVQSYWKGYLARKESRGQLLDLRLRVQKSASNVDDSMRLINRTLVALSELLSMKSVSGILHSCATLDMATKHSQKCCEKLVDAGAIDTLLQLIRSVSQSIPDQQVLRHALSTLRNLAHYPHLSEVLIDSHRSVETIFWVLLRNKEEGYFIASELLKKICSNHNGIKAVRGLHVLLKRLHSLVEDLTRKISNEKRKVGVLAAKENSERRLREAVELLKLTAT